MEEEEAPIDEQKLMEVREVFTLFDRDGDATMAIKDVGTALRSLGIDISESELHIVLNEVRA